MTQDRRQTLDRLRALPYLAGVPVEASSKAGGVVVHDRARSQPGYNLYSAYALARADLIDIDGRIVRSWSEPSSQRWSNCELLPNGDLLAVGSGPNPNGGGKRYLMRLSWDGDVLWQRWISAHHDVELTPNRQLLTLTSKRHVIPEIAPEIKTRDNYLTYLDQDGEVLDSISLFQIFSSRPDLFEFQRVAPSVSRASVRGIDLFHANSIESSHHERLFGTDPIYDPSNVLISIRHQDVIAIVDPGKRQLVWVWGRGELSGPHDAEMLDNGHIIVFDNGLSPDRQWSRVVEVDPLSRRIVWEYQAPERTDFFTAGRGSSQRLANGNTLIASAGQAWAFEVTPDSEIVWEFHCPLFLPDGRRATIVRMKRYDLDYLDDIRAQQRP